MRLSSFGVVVLGVMITVGTGCALEGDDVEDSTEVVRESSTATFEQLAWRQGSASEWQNKLPDMPFGPCNCGGEGCMEEWVDESFGCDVCVSISCTTGPPEHICVACP